MLKYWTIIFVIAVVVFAFWLGQLAQDNETIRQIVRDYGYIGIFIIALISGFNLAVPVPAISFLPLFLESGLSTLPIIFIISIGVTIADMIAYFFGLAGRQIIKNNKIYRLELLLLRHKSHKLSLFILFLFSALVPLPNEILALPLGLLGYRPLAIFAVTLSGNFIFNTIYGLGLVKLFNSIL